MNRISERLRKEELDYMLICDPMTIKYLTGHYFDCMERMCVLLIGADGSRLLMVGKLFVQPQDYCVPVYYFDDCDDYVGMLADKLINPSRIGIDKKWPAKFLIPFMKHFANCEFVESSYIVDEIRQIKTETEQRAMLEASKLNDAAMDKLIPLVTAGYTERELGDKLLEIYQSMGAAGHSFDPIVGYGDNAADPHHESDDTKLTGGSVVLDVGCVLNGYCSDMTRTVFVGEPSEETRKIYEIVKEANRRGREAVRPGVTYSEIDHAARDYIESMGYGEYFTHRLGHNIGMEVHEWGDVSSTNMNVVKPGMCFSIEPGIYKPGVCGVRIEDLVLVTETGRIDMNNYNRDLIVL